MERKVLVEMTDRGTITLPKAMRRGATLFEARVREDGIVELIPQQAIDATQAWFWSERWQRMEREADADIAAGRISAYEDPVALIAGLDEADSSAGKRR